MKVIQVNGTCKPAYARLPVNAATARRTVHEMASDPVHAGMPPLDIIRATTVNAAEMLGWQDRVGTVEAGRFADLVAVAGDPVKDISELERIRSSTNFSPQPVVVWGTNFQYGPTELALKTTALAHFVRLVRGGQAFNDFDLDIIFANGFE